MSQARHATMRKLGTLTSAIEYNGLHTQGRKMPERTKVLLHRRSRALGGAVPAVYSAKWKINTVFMTLCTNMTFSSFRMFDRPAHSAPLSAISFNSFKTAMWM